MGLEAAPPRPGRLGLSLRTTLSLPAQPAAPDVTPAQGVGVARSQGARD